MIANCATRLAFVTLAGLTLSACLGNSRPDAAFPNSLSVRPPRGGAPVVLAGRVEASRSSIATLERRVVLTADGADLGRATLPDARIGGVADLPVAINTEYQNVPVSALCRNQEVTEPAGERHGILHRLTFAQINCDVNYAGRPAGTLSMLHAPAGNVVQPAAVTAAR